MTKNNTVPWQLIDKRTMLGKISNKLEKHGDEEVVGFMVPFSELMIDPPEQCLLLRDKYFDRCAFNKVKGALTPCDWLGACEPISLSDSYEDAVMLMTISGDRELEFDGGMLKDLKLDFDPKYGGQAALSGKLYLRPGIGKENLQLQEHQHREVRLTITNATVMLKAKAKQQDMFAAQGESEETEDEGEQDPEELFEKPKAKSKRGRKGRNGNQPAVN